MLAVSGVVGGRDATQAGDSRPALTAGASPGLLTATKPVGLGAWRARRGPRPVVSYEPQVTRARSWEVREWRSAARGRRRLTARVGVAGPRLIKKGRAVLCAPLWSSRGSCGAEQRAAPRRAVSRASPRADVSAASTRLAVRAVLCSTVRHGCDAVACCGLYSTVCARAFFLRGKKDGRGGRPSTIQAGAGKLRLEYSRIPVVSDARRSLCIAARRGARRRRQGKRPPFRG